MKRFLLLTCLFFSAGLYAQHNKTYFLSTDIQYPDSVRSLVVDCWLYCKKDTIISRLLHIDRYKNLETLSIQGMGSPQAPLNLHIESLDVPLDKMPNLKDLTFYGSDIISEIPAWVFKCKQLLVLRLTETEVTEIPDQIGSMTGLKDLQIYGMHTSALRKWNPKLKQISKLTPALLNIKLESLTLRYVNLDDWAGEFRMLAKIPSLKRLNISDCSISVVPKELGLMTHLESLMLVNQTGFDSNTFKTLPSEIYQLVKLKELYVDWGMDKQLVKSRLPAGCKLIPYEACFPASAKVLLANGDEKRIDQVRVGDSVMSYNYSTCTAQMSLVKSVAVHREQVYDLWKIYMGHPGLTASNANGPIQTLSVVATPNHPFLLEKGVAKRLEGMTENDMMQIFDTGGLSGAKISYIDRDYAKADEVYNLVTEQGNYFINRVNVAVK